MKPQRQGPKSSDGARASAKAKRRTSRGRTSRACDRCRVKKAKCDGAQVCKTCRACDSPCVYSARRRESRNYYCQMREVTDNALQRLYWACRRGGDFPGQIPNESTGVVTTTDILKGLGLINPEFDELDLPKEIEQTIQVPNGADQAKRPLQAIQARDDEVKHETSSTVSSYSTFNSPHMPCEQVPMSGSQLSTSEPTTPTEEIDMKEQFLVYSPGSKSAQYRKERNNSSNYEQRQPFFHQAETVIEPQHMDVESFLDMSFCTPSASSQSSYSNYQLMPPSMPPMNTPQFSSVRAHQSPSDLMYDSYLSPWPGSLAAAHHWVAT